LIVKGPCRTTLTEAFAFSVLDQASVLTLVNFSSISVAGYEYLLRSVDYCNSDMAVRKPGKLPINLLTGWPNPRLLPLQQLSHAATNALGNPELVQDVLGYGPDLGFPPLRQSISRWLTQFYKPVEPISPDRIAISGGASQNLARILQTYTDPIFTRTCFLVTPVYFLACRIFCDSGFDGRLKAVPEDEEGIDLEALRRGLEESERKASEEGNTEPVSPRP
jgi:DNA-binding transcriptional MocR family regulator